MWVNKRTNVIHAIQRGNVFAGYRGSRSVSRKSCPQIEEINPGIGNWLAGRSLKDYHFATVWNINIVPAINRFYRLVRPFRVTGGLVYWRATVNKIALTRTALV
jgi:hypothetical protein